ncbi:ester cyclase [Candidatus Nitrosocosmicus arcticus]|nr:ester cyclase [Candidatus Nitrosocosmicus arcticus]
MKLSSRKNRQEIFYNLILEINNHQINRILSMVTDEILIKSDGFGRRKGKIIVNNFLSEVFLSFPDFCMKPLTLCYSNNNHGIVMSEINVAGQQLGLFMGNPPSDKRFSINSVFVFEFDELMKVKMIRIYYDSKLMFRQLEILNV